MLTESVLRDFKRKFKQIFANFNAEQVAKNRKIPVTEDSPLLNHVFKLSLHISKEFDFLLHFSCIDPTKPETEESWTYLIFEENPYVVKSDFEENFPDFPEQIAENIARWHKYLSSLCNGMYKRIKRHDLEHDSMLDATTLLAHLPESVAKDNFGGDRKSLNKLFKKLTDLSNDLDTKKRLDAKSRPSLMLFFIKNPEPECTATMSEIRNRVPFAPSEPNQPKTQFFELDRRQTPPPPPPALTPRECRRRELRQKQEKAAKAEAASCSLL